MSEVEGLARAYLAAADGDAGRALRRAIADLQHVAAHVSPGFVRGRVTLPGTVKIEKATTALTSETPASPLAG